MTLSGQIQYLPFFSLFLSLVHSSFYVLLEMKRSFVFVTVAARILIQYNSTFISTYSGVAFHPLTAMQLTSNALDTDKHDRPLRLMGNVSLQTFLYLNLKILIFVNWESKPNNTLGKNMTHDFLVNCSLKLFSCLSC